MTVVPSVTSIEQLVEKHKLANTYLDEATSKQCSSDLKELILHGQDKARAIIALQVVLHLSKPNDGFEGFFDEALFDGILKALSKSSPVELYVAVLRILLTFLSGRLFETTQEEAYLVPFLNAMNSNGHVLRLLTLKMYTGNADLIVKIASFVQSYINIDHIGIQSLSHLLEFLLTLGKCDFYYLVGNFTTDSRFNGNVHAAIDGLMKSILQALEKLSRIPLSDESTFQNEIISEVCNDLAKTSRDDERVFIREHFSVLQLLDLFSFLESHNISFKKEYHQQLLFTLEKEQVFPISIVSAKVTDIILSMYTKDTETYPKLSQNVFIRDILHYNMIAKFLDVWIESQAELEDVDNLLPLLSIILQYIEGSIEHGEIDIGLKIQSEFKSLTYNDLRQIQLDNFKEHIDESTSDEMVSFDLILKEQVFDFVKHQRFLQLSKGSWVYAEAPSFKNSSQTSSSYYFIILSPNFTQLLFKQFDKILPRHPNIDKSGHAIPVSSIAHFKIAEIPYSDGDSRQYETNSRMVNLVDNTVIHRITLINRKNKPLFTFFAKKTDSLAWVDGLNLLLGNYTKLSKDLNQQINRLFEVRKTVQLLNFDGDESPSSEDAVNIDGDEASLEFLESLSSNFYYT
ncbi:Lmo1p CYBJADRAFT_73478 [Cyberlindnera jadinii NRRL Y-1542]|uniref:PH domain-containing protein n=1 Tax=Cyberlindnera jadinii (strain ATCC 18201 / CBS 1600 / BCRC 20928 / JCM 3617 / NBRC 0987 / NRRL Y-1542) TaxID=983966 RepID=A0A1E4S4J3_CYBJN|nr:hypothetical protein CYBJADRAFT_73478 [Cyberlindnera jadinii NRRL Y-1542]ODV74434.1 hypothetical protein CYBJADRAFT_73478 [Cyberlindnera jadinii NRRL Y-1542]